MIIRTGMELAAKSQRPVLGLMRGSESYKSEWRPTTVQNERLMMYRPRSLAGVLYVRTAQLRAVLVPVLHARTPRLAAAGRLVRRHLRTGARGVARLTGPARRKD